MSCVSVSITIRTAIGF